MTQHDRHRAADRAAPARARPPSAQAPGTARLLDLQRSAGNRAVAAGLAVQRVGVSPPGQLSQAVDDLHGWLVATHGPPESVLMTLLVHKNAREELLKTYDTRYRRSLDKDLGALPSADALRARCYLNYGELRLADKLYLAIHGLLTDEVTVTRLAPQVKANRAAAEDDFTRSYGTDYPESYKLPDGTTSRIAGAVMRETAWATFAQRFRIAALLAFGAPRAADEVKIATVQGTNDAPLLFNALQREDPKKIATDFEASYGEPVVSYLSRETSLHTKARALLFFDKDVAPEDILIRTVVIAISGYTTADTDFIFDAVAHATEAQIAKFKGALATKDPRLSNLTATFGGMSKADLDRFNALLGIGADAGILADPAVKLLRSLGGNNADGVFDVLRNATDPNYTTFRTAYQATGTPFRRFVDQYTSNHQRGYLASYVFADLRPRLDYVLTNPGNDDYVLFLLTSFADAGTRRALAADAAFGAKVGALGTATRNKILLILEPAHLTPAERAVWLDATVTRETGSGAGSLTGASAALADENRELQAAVIRGGKNPDAAAQAEIDRLTAATKEALTAFLAYRDELEATVASVVEMAAGLLAGLLTGGVASVEFALLAVARAAVASAMTKVVANKLAKGDRFDVVGADGAQAFVSGAVDGMLNTVAPVLGKGLATPALEEAATSAARQAAPGAFRQFMAANGPKMAEGTIVGGISGAVDTMTRDATWGQGFDKGMRQVLLGAVQSAAAGGAMAALPPGIAAAVAAGSSAETLAELIDAMPEPDVTLATGTLDLAPVAARHAEALPVQRNYGLEFETYATSQLLQGGLGGLPPMAFIVSGGGKSGQGLDRFGVAIENGQLKVYHFEMKWRDIPEQGAKSPSVELNKLRSGKKGTQTGAEWTARAIGLLRDGDNPEAVAVRAELRVQLSKVLGLPPGKLLSEQEVKNFLSANMNAVRVVVVPFHVSIKKLLRQLAGMIRHDGRETRVVRSALPKRP
ncbi:hypothetical protein [Longispora urticae]